ncbi:LysR family transcriptional regulator [Agrobacterium vitis]|uniref:HTH-type transcriptional regulator TtuA n=1 Tax=Agrobacterium vitis TaxID=373 RepID=A0AAE4WI51_AGRVI|nr:LysR substrate-binding domain-containing protein [Agrobacterium vitis]MCF1501431.1 LysR family transcriptional regulator [Allorhizobium sp. Av2]MCM2443043.1 LysR family transcriptional regulator [Agrobacterium vitis]MUZ60709.1 LysR family transcriptional regulator [Agrobacterium vitis]MVA68261.1 LysR family transcriptional regulator [Agrobacterium vitis]MVA89982.1 LysR family transcriptional regulator [Agrobacterium vitis]
MPRILMERSGEMEVFARVVQDGGFSAAARNLDITPSAVSKLIARLEARLGTRLLVRTTRAVTLTQEGEAYHHAALRILQELNEADQEAAGGAVRGRLRINTTIPFGTMFVAPAIPEFVSRNPDLIVDLSFTDGIVDLVAEKTDVAIRMGNLPDSGLIARKLGQSRRVVCASPDYLARRGSPQTPADLAYHDCLTFNFRRARPSWPFRDRDRDIAQLVQGSIVVNNGETMKQMVLAGAAIARVGLFHVADDIAAGRLIPLLEDFNPGDLELVHAVYVGGGPLPHRVRAFIEHMVVTLGDSPLLKGTS